MPVAIALAAALVLIGVWSMYAQARLLNGLPRRAMPADERKYLKRRAYRRLVTGVLLLALAGMLAGSYLSGLEARFDALGDRNGDPPLNPEEKRFVRIYTAYWGGILALTFLVISAAIVDIWATRRYAMGQYRRLRDDHRQKLERDLAMYRQQHRDRMRPGG